MTYILTMRISLLARAVVIVTISSVGLVAMPVLATAADAPPYVASWSQVPAKVTQAQTVWALRSTAGLDLHSTTGIASEACEGQPGYLVSALYGQVAAKEMNVLQQPAASCADKGYSFYAVVGRITKPGAKIEISAQCGWDAKNNEPVASWAKGPQPCKAADVKTTGGLIHLTQTAKTKAKSKSVVWIETTGLTYAQLVKVANGLKPLY